MGRRNRTRRRRTRGPRTHLYRWVRLALRTRALRSAACVVILAVALVNSAVRYIGGGDPSLLSPFHLTSKVRALTRFVLHVPVHPFAACRSSQNEMIREAARTFGVPAPLIRAIALTESSHRPHAISHAGAMGVMQLMPDTATLMEVRDPFDPKQSIHGGTRYLAGLLRRYGGDRRRAVAAYHAGPGAVPRRGPLRVGDTTRRYVEVVLRRAGRGRPSAIPAR